MRAWEARMQYMSDITKIQVGVDKKRIQLARKYCACTHIHEFQFDLRKVRARAKRQLQVRALISIRIL
jgi:hypothetical protein